MYRPTTWGNPYRAKLLKAGCTGSFAPGTCVSIPYIKDKAERKSLENCMGYQGVFEAGADAMLKALRANGLKVNNSSPENKGLVIFIPEEK